LDAPQCAFFIHLDAKVDETIFKQTVGASSKITFITDRRKVNWGAFSMVEATLALLSEALSSSSSFHRFCLLSGSDFPIKPNTRILADFDSPTEFMRIARKLNSGQSISHDRNVRFYWYLDSEDHTWWNCSGKLPRKPYSRVGLYHGSQWWALTRECVEYILQFISSNQDYYSFFKNAYCSDEIFFHSIVKHSPFAVRISHDFETAPDQAALSVSNDHGSHYVDWNASSKTLPKVLDEQDWDKLVRSKALFARKFDEGRSGALIAMLENELASRAPVP